MELTSDIFSLFNKKWAIVTAGTIEHFNGMTISWGGLGTLWSTPVATVYVKPCRYTYQFMNENEYFTISFFPEENRQDMVTMGRISGRDGDKIAQTNLHPVALDKAVMYEEAEITLVCKKIYAQNLQLDQIPEFAVERYYTEEAPHRMFVGEVIDIIRK